MKNCYLPSKTSSSSSITNISCGIYHIKLYLEKLKKFNNCYNNICKNKSRKCLGVETMLLFRKKTNFHEKEKGLCL